MEHYTIPETTVYTPEEIVLTDVYVTRQYAIISPNYRLGIITIQDVGDTYFKTRFFNIPAIIPVVSDVGVTNDDVDIEIDNILEAANFTPVV